MKLLPDLRATSERFTREITAALISAGYKDVVTIGHLKSRNIDVN